MTLMIVMSAGIRKASEHLRNRSPRSNLGTTGIVTEGSQVLLALGRRVRSRRLQSGRWSMTCNPAHEPSALPESDVHRVGYGLGKTEKVRE